MKFNLTIKNVTIGKEVSVGEVSVQQEVAAQEVIDVVNNNIEQAKGAVEFVKVNRPAGGFIGKIASIIKNVSKADHEQQLVELDQMRESLDKQDAVGIHKTTEPKVNFLTTPGHIEPEEKEETPEEYADRRAREMSEIVKLRQAERARLMEEEEAQKIADKLNQKEEEFLPEVLHAAEIARQFGKEMTKESMTELNGRLVTLKSIFGDKF